MVVLDDEFQGAGELLGLSPFPMEIHADGHPIEDERRLREHRRHRLGIEGQLVVKHSVVGYTSVFI